MITHRLLVPADAEAVAALHAASWRSAYRGILPERYLDDEVAADRLALWHGRLAAPDPRGRGVVACEGATMIGFAFGLADHSPTWGHLLDNLHLLPDRRGGRLGEGLLRALLDAFPAAPDRPLHLWVFDGNASACRFYGRLGATRVHGEVVDTPGGGRAPASVYRWLSMRALREALPETLISK